MDLGGDDDQELRPTARGDPLNRLRKNDSHAPNTAGVVR